MDMKFKIYDGKTFEDLCKDIVTNQNQKKDQIELLISELRPLIKTVNDAMAVVPLIKQYIDSGITNDDHLVRLANIIQRLVAPKVGLDGGEKGTGFLTDDEKNQLMKEVEKEMRSMESVDKEVSSAEVEVKSVVIKNFKKD